MRSHSIGCSCSSPACVQANRKQRGFDTFLLVVFAGLYLAGIYAVIRSGLFAWVKF